MCKRASAARLLHSQVRGEDTFISTGFRNWKKGPEKLNRHARSDFHRHAMLKVAAMDGSGLPDQLVGINKKNQQAAQKALALMFLSVCYLGEQGFPLRGREHDSGAFTKLVLRRAQEDCDQSVAAFLKTRNNWMSDTVQNEIIAMCGEFIQRSIMTDVGSSSLWDWWLTALLTSVGKSSSVSVSSI